MERIPDKYLIAQCKLSTQDLFVQAKLNLEAQKVARATGHVSPFVVIVKHQLVAKLSSKYFFIFCSFQLLY